MSSTTVAEQEEEAAAVGAVVEPEAEAEVEPQFKPYGPEDECDLNPEFAVICSFIANFSDKLEVTLNLEQLKYSIEDQSYLDDDLIDLHVKLFKKLRRYFVRDQWEKALIRFASEYSYEHAYELETLGYQKTRPSIKLELLRRLLDAQFECDQKFKSSVNLCEADQLRNAPLGRDIKGNTYWHQVDGEGNFKIFEEQPLDYKSWKTICSTPEQLEQLISNLEAIKEEKVKGEPILEPYNPLPEIFPEFFSKKEKLEEISNENDLKNGKSKKAAKGNNNRGKKTTNHPLSIIKEEESNSSSIVNTRLDNNQPSDEKPNGIVKLPQPQSPTDNSSHESQIKSTVENLINRVVSSIEFLIKPLSRSPTIETKPVEPPVAIVKPQKKRTVKKERVREEILPRRSSSRIQQLQQKKQEEEMKKILESNSNKQSDSHQLDEDSRSSMKNNTKRSESPEDRAKNGKRRRKNDQSWRRGKGKKKLSWAEDDSDLSSTSTLTESDDDLDDEDVSFKFDTNTYDDEFACEDEETNNEPVIVKRARTARQSLGLDEQNDLNTSSISEEDKPCGRCSKSHDPEWILLCDMCDDGYHTSCCLPPLMIIPDGDWFCPSCEHKMLLTKLNELKVSINEILEVKERERKKKQRLRQTTIKKELIKTEAKIVKEKLPPKRNRDFLTELNDSIAVQALDDEEMEESSRSSSSKVSAAESGESFERNPKTRRARASVSYRFQEYDELMKSAIQEDSYDEDKSDNDHHAPKRANYGRGKDIATIEALAYQQENGISEPSVMPVECRDEPPPAKTRKPRKKARRLNDLDASESENETSDESFQASSATEVDDDEEDDLTEANMSDETETSLDELIDVKRFKSRKPKKRSKSYDSDDSDYCPTQTRRAATRRQINYKESTDEEEEEEGAEPSRVSKGRGKKKNTLSSDESQTSWISGKSSEAEDEEEEGEEEAEEVEEDDRSTSCAESEPDNDELANDKEISAKREPTVSINEVKQEPEIPPPVPIPAPKPEQELHTSSIYKKPNSITNEQNHRLTPERPSDVSLDELVDISPHQPRSRPITLQPKEPPLQAPSPAARLQFDKVRDPIQELNQYCSESANSTSMFNSYIETLLSKNSPPHPAFYEEDEMKPS